VFCENSIKIAEQLSHCSWTK